MLTKYGKQMTYEDLRLLVNEEQTRRGGGIKSFLCSLVAAFILSISVIFPIKQIFMYLRFPIVVVVVFIAGAAWFYSVYAKQKVHSLIDKAGLKIERAKQAVVEQVEKERQEDIKGEE